MPTIQTHPVSTYRVNSQKAWLKKKHKGKSLNLNVACTYVGDTVLQYSTFRQVTIGNDISKEPGPFLL